MPARAPCRGRYTFDDYNPDGPEGVLSAEAYLLCPTDACWLPLRPSGSPPTPRSLHSAVLLERGGDGSSGRSDGGVHHVAIFGGWGIAEMSAETTPWVALKQISSATYLNDLHLLALHSHLPGAAQWSSIRPPGPSPTPRCGASLIASCDGGILLFGGHDADGCVSRPHLDVLMLPGVAVRTAVAATATRGLQTNGGAHTPEAAQEFAALTVLSGLDGAGGGAAGHHKDADVAATSRDGGDGCYDPNYLCDGLRLVHGSPDGALAGRSASIGIESLLASQSGATVGTDGYAMSADTQGMDVASAGIGGSALGWVCHDVTGEPPPPAARLAAVAVSGAVMLLVPPPAGVRPGEALLGANDEAGVSIFVCAADGYSDAEYKSGPFQRMRRRDHVVLEIASAVDGGDRPAGSSASPAAPNTTASQGDRLSKYKYLRAPTKPGKGSGRRTHPSHLPIVKRLMPQRPRQELVSSGMPMAEWVKYFNAWKAAPVVASFGAAHHTERAPFELAAAGATRSATDRHLVEMTIEQGLIAKKEEARELALDYHVPARRLIPAKNAAFASSTPRVEPLPSSRRLVPAPTAYSPRIVLPPTEDELLAAEEARSAIEARLFLLPQAKKMRDKPPPSASSRGVGGSGPPLTRSASPPPMDSVPVGGGSSAAGGVKGGATSGEPFLTPPEETDPVELRPPPYFAVPPPVSVGPAAYLPRLTRDGNGLFELARPAGEPTTRPLRADDRLPHASFASSSPRLLPLEGVLTSRVAHPSASRARGPAAKRTVQPTRRPTSQPNYGRRHVAPARAPPTTPAVVEPLEFDGVWMAADGGVDGSSEHVARREAAARQIQARARGRRARAPSSAPYDGACAPRSVTVCVRIFIDAADTFAALPQLEVAVTDAGATSVNIDGAEGGCDGATIALHEGACNAFDAARPQTAPAQFASQGLTQCDPNEDDDEEVTAAKQLVELDEADAPVRETPSPSTSRHRAEWLESLAVPRWRVDSVSADGTSIELGPVFDARMLPPSTSATDARLAAPCTRSATRQPLSRTPRPTPAPEPPASRPKETSRGGFGGREARFTPAVDHAASRPRTPIGTPRALRNSQRLDNAAAALKLTPAEAAAAARARALALTLAMKPRTPLLSMPHAATRAYANAVPSATRPATSRPGLVTHTSSSDRANNHGQRGSSDQSRAALYHAHTPPVSARPIMSAPKSRLARGGGNWAADSWMMQPEGIRPELPLPSGRLAKASYNEAPGPGAYDALDLIGSGRDPGWSMSGRPRDELALATTALGSRHLSLRRTTIETTPQSQRKPAVSMDS